MNIHNLTALDYFWIVGAVAGIASLAVQIIQWIREQ